MGFRCDPKTLDRLEWPHLAECLAREAATSRGAEACRGDLFSPSPEGARKRLVETSEVRALLDGGEDLSLAGVQDLRDTLRALSRGSLLDGSEFANLLSTLQTAGRVRSFLAERSNRVPSLAALARGLPDLRSLEQRLSRAVTPEGELRDDASQALRRVRRRVHDLEGEVQQRMAACMRAPGIQPYLQDHYVTMRENRPVLPIRADSRQYVPGIVHDVSSSGTTVFIEPEAVVEISNRLRIARRELVHEVERLLRELGNAVRAEEAAIDSLGGTLEVLDVIRARGRLSRRLDASEPDTAEDAPIALRQLRHPLLLLEAGLAPEEVVPNDLVLPSGTNGLVISGPNAGGKTVAAKALGLAALSLRAGLHVACAEGSRMPILDQVAADIGDEQDLRSGLSTFSARMSNLARIVAEADTRTLVIVDEVGEGTEPGEGASLAQAILEALVAAGAFVIATTHFNRLKELAGADPRFINASAEFDRETLLPSYRLRMGIPGSSGAIWVAQRMGLGPSVVERSRVLLDHDDRKLEALTRELSELRQELEAERREAVEVREQTETVRTEYEQRLASLRVAREKALSAMKSDLEAAFRRAQDEIAAVMRSLQRGSAPDGRAANRARERLDTIRDQTEVVEQRHGERSTRATIPTGQLAPGARVVLEGVTGEAVILEPPDRRDRLAVRVGGVRMTVPRERVLRVVGAPTPKVPKDVRVNVERAEIEGGVNVECDLRGLRVDEALDRADAHLHRMLARGGIHEVSFIHGHGTGALREAIRTWLRGLPEVTSFTPGAPNQGGNGVTIAALAR
jgi:DNA mismatch repair protein MutS2